ncbi:MAG TPA: LPS assembly protein LptD [Humisphaera sp.]
MLDYFGDRGPAAGVSARYQGGDVAEGSGQPWSFEGGLRSYFVYDHGYDQVGRATPQPPPGEEFDSRLRGHILFEHQHVLPDHWQAQIRAGWVSDQEFLEQWFPKYFDRELPHDVSVYLKRQQDTEAFTLLLQVQPNDVVTTADLMQEQFEVEHFPEIGYRRIGDDLGGIATFYSENTVAGLHFQRTRYSLAEQGFVGAINTGLPSLGTTGVTDDTVWRGDFRQEVTFPFSAGPLRVVPYVMGRYTAYTDSPEHGTVHRLFGGVGARVSTAFWKVDDLAESELFDIHRLRHVIEPQVNVFTSASTYDRNDVFVYDERVDSINDVSAVQFGVQQRWQTYRGGPGRWRSVDFLTLNVEAVLFANQPNDAALNPRGFRGLFFNSLPEASVPRNAINADLTWRVADTTAILADVSWNADRSKLATASVGIVAQRDERLSYYVGTRYIDEINSNITTVAIDYQLSSKYNLSIAQAFDFGLGENVVSSVGVIRKFDTFFLVLRAFHNETTDQSGVSFNITPRWLKASADTDVLNSALETRRR